jgi:uncharacterized protein (TIGR03083 family)
MAYRKPQTLLAAVEAVGPDTAVSTFLGPKAASWWIRRRLHEATAHRADAAIALGAPYQLSAELAADGITKWLARLACEQALGGPGPTPAGTSLALRAADPHMRDTTWTIRGTLQGVRWTGQPASADLILSGPAVDLLLALVRRRPVEDTGISLQGDTALWRSWLALTPL